MIFNHTQAQTDTIGHHVTEGQSPKTAVEFNDQGAVSKLSGATRTVMEKMVSVD
jgi:hypothetical protein